MSKDGVTQLNIRPRGARYEVWFDRENGGASGWQSLTDAFRSALEALQQFGVADQVVWPDGRRPLGKGISVLMPRPVLLLTIGLWREDARVETALQRQALRVVLLRGAPKGWLKEGPRYLQEMRAENPPGNPSTDYDEI